MTLSAPMAATTPKSRVLEKKKCLDVISTCIHISFDHPYATYAGDDVEPHALPPTRQSVIRCPWKPAQP